MIVHRIIHSRKTTTLALGAMFAAGLFTVSARADEWTKRTTLTVKEPIQVSNAVLQPGKYVFRLILNGTLGVDRHVVQVFDGKEQHIIETVVTQATIRPHATGTTQFTWWETPPGTARALRDWYYPGETTGDEFPYPKQAKLVATVVPPPPMNAASSETTTTTAAPPEPTPAPAETPEAQPEPAPQQPAAAPPAPAETPAPAPAELPKTGSQYSLIGLCGIALAGLGGTLLLKRTA
ncbi:MAG TPA: LPXTG cell wall anchor domain-containing protein [Bryobacteraceae bacterium]|nr:LPXTG cell wall anchor domain-containing protein [Bryobacteraceae bacterium]